MNEKQKIPYYDSNLRGPLPLLELREAFQYRDAIILLTRRDIVSRYKRSFLGIFWTMLNPLGMTLILSVVFSNIFGRGIDYAAYVLSGLLAWNFFSQSSNAVISGLSWGSGLIHKIYIPRSIFGISAITTGLVNLVFALVPLLAVMLFTGVPIRWTIILVPVSMLLLACFALGVGLFLSTIGIFFPDVIEMYQIVLIAWMYITPIIYPESILPVSIRILLTWANPMYRLVTLFRAPLYYGTFPPISDFLITLAMALFFLISGWYFFTRKVDEFAYRI